LIPLFDQSTPLRKIKPRLQERIAAVVDSERFILGPEVSSFEAEFASYLGVDHVIGVANGTDAITIALRALDIGPGDDVVVPSFTFYATAEAVVAAGARPVFCDVDAATCCITADTVRSALTDATKAIVAVDLFGNVAPVDEIAELGLPVVEDAAQAAGSVRGDRHAGSLGQLGTFSFYPGKNLGCFGDGGAVATNDPDLADRIRMLRFHGSRDKVTYQHVGWNSRLDEIQATVLRELLTHLDEWTAVRARALDVYRDAGLGELVRLPKPTEYTVAAWHLFVVFHEEADRLVSALRDGGVEARANYRIPIHRQDPMLGYARGVHLPGTEEAARTNFALPVSAVFGTSQAEVVTSVLRTALS
jgi:dTDP-3-amino-3,4,6-trideoxy-alpha-D-glucose transaminase